MVESRERRFYWFKWVLVLYIVSFTAIFFSLVPLFFGYHLTVQENSELASTIPQKSLVIAKQFHQQPLKKGTVILLSTSTAREMTTIHRIEKVTDQHHYMINIGSKDIPVLELIAKKDILATYAYHLPFIGEVIELVKEYTVTIFAVCVLLYLYTYTWEEKEL